jgi:hypothetical protein
MVDKYDAGTKLLHLSRQHKQPWNPIAACDRDIDKMWMDYCERV